LLLWNWKIERHKKVENERVDGWVELKVGMRLKVEIEEKLLKKLRNIHENPTRNLVDLKNIGQNQSKDHSAVNTSLNLLNFPLNFTSRLNFLQIQNRFPANRLTIFIQSERPKLSRFASVITCYPKSKQDFHHLIPNENIWITQKSFTDLLLPRNHRFCKRIAFKIRQKP
jgi:hypothetical protein